MHKAILQKIFIFILLAAVISCSSKKEQPDTSEITYSEEVSRIITHITSGLIAPQDHIAIIFVDDVVTESELNKEIENPFSFTPSIDGKAVWTATDVLEFIPDDPIRSRINYTGELNLPMVSASFDDLEVNLKFYVQGRELLQFTGDLELQDPTDPKVLIYRGNVVFSQPVALEILQTAASFGPHKLEWTPQTEKSYSFVSEPIIRPSESRRITFELDGEDLDLPESVEKSIELVPLENMQITGIEKDELGKYPKLMIRFSDQLAEDQDLRGFITVEPTTDFTLQKLGKYLSIDGEFRFGTTYHITVKQGVKSRWGTNMAESETREVQFSDIQPQVQFASGGVFMPTSNEKKLQFLTANIARVHVEIKKVFDSNVERFFQNETVQSGKSRNSEFNQNYTNSVGAIIYNETFEIGQETNRWLIHNLSFDHVLAKYSNGLYLVRINFNPQDVLVPLNGNELSYIQKYGQIYKPFTISDIGIIAKHHSRDKLDVFTTNLRTGEPIPRVNVTAKRYDYSRTFNTNDEGMATIPNFSYFQLITAEKNGQFSMITPGEMRWSTSGFDIGGISASDLQTRAFIYTERGVYRPGDTVNISCIIRYQSKASDDNIPAYFKLYNPEGTLVLEKTQKGAKDGFYNFTFATDINAPTGNWNAQVNVGNKYFYHDLKIETVVANTLKVKVTPALRTVLPDNKQLKIEVESRYLFGASADGLAYESEVEILDIPNPFAGHESYNFTNQSIEFQDLTDKIASGKLDNSGKANIVWNIPGLSQAPSPLKAKINATVQEEGGRPNDAWTYIDLFPFPHYVGISNEYSYVKLNQTTDIPVVLLDHTGEVKSGKTLNYRIYRNESYWWYQYNSFRDFKLRFKTDQHSYLVEEGTFISGKPYASLPFRPSQRGQYMIEIQDGSVPIGHVSSIFLSAYPYGGMPSGDLNAGTLTLRSEKASYQVGESALLTFPSPRQGNILLTVERGNRILVKKWVKPNPDSEDMNISLKISKTMTPNVYVTVTVLQEHAQTVNDRPIRMFGILPLTVINPETRQELVIKTADELQPKQKFDIHVSTLNGKPTQFTVAVVDEGLLDITNFKTPDPWMEFYKKIMLDVDTYDVFGHVIGANENDVFKTFSIGGDMDYRESQVDPFEKKKRFKPVCMFKGPMMTDSNGKATVSFEMPNYVGSVRVMTISAMGETYGSAEKTVPVRSDLIVQPTLPRALKPGDEFDIPVNVFATREKLGSVDISIETEGPLEVVGERAYSHSFEEEGDQLFHFRLRVKEAVGQAKVVIRGKGQTSSSEFEADIPVSPSSSRIYVKEEKTIEPGQTISFQIPRIGLDGTNNARLHLSVFPNMDFLHRLDFLIRYPYGCIEQTTSAVFPQLALKDLIADDEEKNREIDKNINAGIARLRMFQLSDGGFSYWPGGNEASPWGTNYAAQFLFEARKKGYVVPDLMYDGVVRYLELEIRRSNSDEKHLMTRVNRCYVLALGNSAPIDEMNLLKQNSYDKMRNVEKWQLITAYQLAGAFDKVSELTENLSTEVEQYNEFGNTYGSQNRDLGIILQCLVLLERENDATLMAKHLAKTLSGREWYSTQTLGQMLLGIGSYFDFAGINAQDDLIIEGTMTLPDGEQISIKTVDQYLHYIDKGYGEALKLHLNADVDINQLYATLSANGVPLKDSKEEQNRNISMDLDWFDEDGNVIDIRNVKQGTTFYGRYSIRNTSVVPLIQEVALVQILPSGWEIENTRLSGALMPDWMQSWNLGNEEYLDMRDDRIMWFFDLPENRRLDFVVKVNAITRGKFNLPGAQCEAMYNTDYIATKVATQVRVLE